jgi:formylglycine-generating enzyme required for sulfatase activity
MILFFLLFDNQNIQVAVFLIYVISTCDVLLHVLRMWLPASIFASSKGIFLTKQIGKMLSRFTMFLLAALVCCSASIAKGKKHKIRPVRAYNKSTIPAPEGMVYIPGGSILMNYSGQAEDSANYRLVSLSPFFMDKTEVTNSQYREFINWVIDSIAITEYVKDEQYFKNSQRDSTTRYINWAKVGDKFKGPLWQSKNDDVHSKVLPMMDHEEIKKDLVNFTYSYFRPSADKKSGSYVTETINVYPEINTWATDFPNSQTDMMVQAYFTASAFDDYPVVGINWKQAQAYTYWRTKVSGYGKGSKHILNFQLPYALPSEAQWVYAAQAKRAIPVLGDSGVVMRDNRDNLVANFKQAEGEYTEDGSSYTVHVMSYAPNDFGLFNMVGNVAEWTLDAYNESAGAFVHDQNPVLLYDAAADEPDVMKRKVLRGGSWKDNGAEMSAYTRAFEVQDIPHSYIGFRCVMPAPEILTRQVETRKLKTKKTKPVKEKEAVITKAN